MDGNYFNHDFMVKEHTYLIDILFGKLKIYDVPFEHRTGTAYLCACKWAMSLGDKQYAFIQKKAIEAMLLNDIIKISRTGKEPDRLLDIQTVYDYYFKPILWEKPIIYDAWIKCS